MEQLCAQLCTSHPTTSSLAMTSFTVNTTERMDDVRARRAGTAGVPGHCAAAANVPASSVAPRMHESDTTYGGVAVVLPHAKRPSPRCFVPALSRRLAAGGGAAEPPSLGRLPSSRPLESGTLTAALPFANSSTNDNSSTWSAAAAQSRKRTCMQTNHCNSFAGVSAVLPAAVAALGQRGRDSVGAERLSNNSSNEVDLGKSTNDKMLTAGSNRSSNSSVSTTAAAASSWGASSEDGGESASDHQQQNQNEEHQHEEDEEHNIGQDDHRPIKLFRGASARCCFSDSAVAADSLAACVSENPPPPLDGLVMLADAAGRASVSSARAANTSLTGDGRTEALPLLSDLSSGSHSGDAQDVGANSVENAPFSAAVLATTHATDGAMSSTFENTRNSDIATAAAPSIKEVPLASGCNPRNAIVAAEDTAADAAGAAPGLLETDASDPISLTCVSSLLKKHHKNATSASAEKARLLKFHQQQAKLRLKAVAALAAARGACSVVEAAAAIKRGDLRRIHKTHQSSLYTLAAGAGVIPPTSSRHFPLSGAPALDATDAPSNSGTGSSSINAAMPLQASHVLLASRGARNARNATVRQNSAATAAVVPGRSDSSTNGEGVATAGGMETSPGVSVYNSSSRIAAAPGSRHVALQTTGRGAAQGPHNVRAAAATAAAQLLYVRPPPGGAARVMSATSFSQRRGAAAVLTALGQAGTSLPSKAAAGAAATTTRSSLDRSFGGVSERCRLLVYDTSAAYGEDVGIDNVHNTKLAQFCYDQAAFKADKAHPGDYTVNSRRLSPEGRDLLVCVMNKVAAQLAQNTAATAAASSNAGTSSAAAGAQQAKAEGPTTPASDPLSPRAAATVAIAIQLFDRFMQVVFQNDLHYGLAAEHRLHPLYGLSALAALSPVAATAGIGGGGVMAGGSGSSSRGVTVSAAAAAANNSTSHSHTSSNASNTGGAGNSSTVSYSLLNQLIAIACFCFADRVEAIYAYEYAAVLEAWRQQSPVVLTQAWKVGAIAAGGPQGLSTGALKEKLMHIERKIISHVPPSGGNVSVAPLSELVESLLNVAVQFATAGPCGISGSSTTEDGALSEASTAPSPTSVSKSKTVTARDEHPIDKNTLQQQQYIGRSSSKQHHDTMGMSVLHRREAAAARFADPEKGESEALSQHEQQQFHDRRKRALACRSVGDGNATSGGCGGSSTLSPHVGPRCTAAAAPLTCAGDSGRRCLSTDAAAAAGRGRSGTVVAPRGPTWHQQSGASYVSAGADAAANTARKQKCSGCRREWVLPVPSETAGPLCRSYLRMCRSCIAAQKKQQHAMAASTDASLLPAGDLPTAAGKTIDKGGAANNPYALRLRVSGNTTSDVPRLIAQLLVRLGQLDRRICLDFRPSVVAAAAVHIALLPRQGDPTQRFSPLSPAARAIAVKAVVAAGGAACYRLVRRCQSMLMHKWVKVRGAMAVVQRSNGVSSSSETLSASSTSSGLAAGGPSASTASGGSGTALAASANTGVASAAPVAAGRIGTTVSLPERLVAEWALSRLTLPAHRHMLEVLHQLADIWTTYAAASIRSKSAAAAAAAAAGQKQQQQQQAACVAGPSAAVAGQTVGSTGTEGTQATEVEMDTAAAVPAAKKAGSEQMVPYKCSASSMRGGPATSGAGAGGHYYKPHYYIHRPGKGRSVTSSSAEDLLLARRKLAGETRRRTPAATGGGRTVAAPVTHGLLLPLLKKADHSSNSHPLGSKAKLLQPLNASALLKNSASLHAAVTNSSLGGFATLAGLQKELRMMERATTGLQKLQSISLEAAARDEQTQPLLLQ